MCRYSGIGSKDKDDTTSLIDLFLWGPIKWKSGSAHRDLHQVLWIPVNITGTCWSRKDHLFHTTPEWICFQFTWTEVVADGMFLSSAMGSVALEIQQVQNLLISRSACYCTPPTSMVQAFCWFFTWHYSDIGSELRIWFHSSKGRTQGIINDSSNILIEDILKCFI